MNIKNPFIKARGLDFNRKRRGRALPDIKPQLKVILPFGAAILGGFLVAFLFFTGTKVSGVSMTPTLNDTNMVFINKAALVMPLKVGDVVAFNIGEGQGKSISIKRIMALPGDSVAIKNGSLYVNGIKEKDGFEAENISDAGVVRNEIVLGNGEYFLLGDNRNNSEDSRYESVGNVRKSDIIGLVWLCVSLDNFGIIN